MTPTTPPSSAPKTGGFRRGLFSTSFGTALSIAFLFLETALAARVLSSEELGLYGLLVLAVMGLLTIADFGCKTTVTKYLSSDDLNQQAVITQTMLFFRLVVIGIISVVIWFVPHPLYIFDSSGAIIPYARFVPLMLLAVSLDELLLSVLQGFKAYRHMAIMQIIRSALRIGLSWSLLVIWPIGLQALLYSWTISYGVSALYAYLVLPVSKQPNIQRPLLIEMLRFGFPIHINRVVTFMFRRIDVWLLGLLAGPTAVGYYLIATRIPEALIRLSESFISVYFPTVSSFLAAGKKQEATHLLNTSIRLISFVTASIALVSIVFGPEIIRLLFSEAYLASTVAFGIFMLVFHIGFIANLMGYTLTAAGHASRSLAGDMTRTGINIVGNIALIPIFSFVGPAYATLAASYISHPLMLWLLRRSDIIVAVGPHLKQTVLVLIAAGIFWIAQPTSILIKLLIVLAYVALNAALRTVTVADVWVVLPKHLLERLPLPKFLQSRAVD